MVKNKVKIFFFVFGIITIFLSGIYWWFIKTFGKVNILQILWHIENANTLIGFDENVIPHFLRWVSLCLISCIILFIFLYKRSFVYIYI